MQTETDYILRINEVMKLTGLARSTIYKKANNGEFPKATKLGVRASGWRKSKIDAWIAACEAGEEQMVEN